MQSNANTESKRFPAMTATRYGSNHDWCYRGDNTKYKDKK